MVFEAAKITIKILFCDLNKGKESLHASQVTHQARAYPGFCSMK